MSSQNKETNLPELILNSNMFKLKRTYNSQRFYRTVQLKKLDKRRKLHSLNQPMKNTVKHQRNKWKDEIIIIPVNAVDLLRDRIGKDTSKQSK